MKTFLLLLLSLLRSVVSEDTFCFTNTTELFSFLSQVVDGSEDVTVILCSGTVFEIGDLDESEIQVEGGSMPLIAFPRVQYLCGDDGALTNDCIIRGGNTQFWIPPGAEVGTVTVQGLTFEDANFVSIYLQGTGDITFIDCVVKVGLVYGLSALMNS